MEYCADFRKQVKDNMLIFAIQDMKVAYYM
jgi:hypothetical protein